ncbi:Ferrichrome-iron receptor [Paraburkholderia tropica]|uniref:TonB-dependent siderophore receptor n=1 Tax=Paraburkholderia tropica TaxID=92647 RepID=UPI001CAE02DC|nr:TonB-dependent siderophore receptor [Paraburkholderia tropica]CAG9212199.1 Ferrichrome-iron receptor [Paraburkholderia tropica]
MRKSIFRLRVIPALLIGAGTLTASLAHADDSASTAQKATNDTTNDATSGTNKAADNKVHSLATVTINGSRQQAPKVSSGALGTRSDLETPFSTRVVTQQELEDRQVKSLGKVFAEDAAVMSLGDTYSFNAYSINVRGIPLDDYNGYKINGLPFYMTTVELPVESFESIQLLKGASGFMYGFGAPGGIINFVTKKPTDTFTFSADVGYSSDSVFSQHIDTGGRFGPDSMFGYRFNITHEQGETYNDSHVLRNSESLSLDARLTRSLTWTFDGLYQSRKVDGGIQDVMLSDYTGTSLPRAPSGRTNLSAYGDTFFNSNVYFVSSGLHWQIDPVWKASIDYSHSKDERSYSGQWLDLLNEQGDFNTYLNRSRGSSIYDVVQATLEGKFSTGPVDHQVVLGVSQQWLTKKTVPSYLYTDIGSNNLYDTITQHTWDGTYDYSQQYNNFNSQQKSIFASDTLSFLKYWSILAGIRYTSYHQTSWTSPSASPVSYTQNPVTPTLALMFRPRSDLLFYASYVEALEDGGTAAEGYANANQVLDPIKSKQYEVGVKYDGRHVGASAALFRIERGAEYGNAQNVYVSNGKERINGLELDGHVDLPAGFRVAASTAWEAGTYSETEADLIGKRIEGIPRWQATLQLSDRIPGVTGLTANAEAHYYGSMMADANNNYVLPSFTLFNAGLSYRTTVAGHGVTLRAEVDNIFDRHYWGFLQSDYMFVGAPRTVALNARFDL